MVAPFQFFRTGVDQQNVFELAFGQRDEVVHLLVRNDQRHLGRLVVHALGRDQLGRLDFLKPHRRDSHEDQVMDGGLPTDSAPSGLRRLLVVHRNETADTHSVELQLYLQFPVKGGLEYVPEPGSHCSSESRRFRTVCRPESCPALWNWIAPDTDRRL